MCTDVLNILNDHGVRFTRVDKTETVRCPSLMIITTTPEGGMVHGLAFPHRKYTDETVTAFLRDNNLE